ncbi:peptide/nickel transport system permease protein [Agreia bicolorata]|uniref:Peptide/nickel transport system permease protein n=1 Tax=Agreia bicolorata TaxID=110935 RepID=A0A1T4WXZ8_9MICO|nr:dipeptide/oligopeptide/nickel ABC transporter permease/ATP-binding protein [Agreia bicolorata]SKA81738.1 peptide/nickel transport system permease protein [Agreia bicolorata]
MSNPVRPTTQAVDISATRASAAPRRTVHRILSSRKAVISGAIILGLIVIAIAAPLIAPYDPLAPDPSNALSGPTAAHWLGTDDIGRDTLSRLIYGIRTSLIASFEAVIIAVVLGVGLGLLIGYASGLADRIGMRVADAFQALPPILLALVLASVIGTGLVNAMVGVGIIFAVSFFRITRGEVLVQRELLYVKAARVGGFRLRAILFREILPNIAPTLVVQGAIALGMALLVEAMLGFLGVGQETTQVSWGTMLNAAQQYQLLQPVMTIAPGLAITAVVLLFNLLGDGINESIGNDRNRSGRAKAWFVRSGAPSTSRPPAVVETTAASDPATLAVSNLSVVTGGEGGTELVSAVSFEVRRGETVALVGESGCGKSMTAKALMGLLPPGVAVSEGSVRVGGVELVGADSRTLRDVRGNRIGMIFQDSISSLSPVHTIGRQLSDAVRAHKRVSRKEARRSAAELLTLVGVPNAEARLSDYPHQFSGGMAQRVGIAAALAGDPDVLIADEPTTALDVTIQARVLDLLMELRDRLGLAVVLITHDLGVVADSADRVAVMYAGQVVEYGEVGSVFARPQHPYTQALLDASPGVGSRVEEMATIPGSVPPPWEWSSGCRFADRCAFASRACSTAVPLVNGVRCVRADELQLRGLRREGASSDSTT